MRLRLVIKRHNLPVVNILWDAAGLIPGDAIQPKDITISHLLVQVNELVPLESEGWGLEDYVVEVHGFECLHFYTLDRIVKEDDVLTIRPLDLIERRYRRVSGRRQIAANGMHLVDGVGFGRQLTRRIIRPVVKIPPLQISPADNSDDESAGDHDKGLLPIRDESLSLVNWTQPGSEEYGVVDNHVASDDEEDDEDYESELSHDEDGASTSGGPPASDAEAQEPLSSESISPWAGAAFPPDYLARNLLPRRTRSQSRQAVLQTARETASALSPETGQADRSVTILAQKPEKVKKAQRQTSKAVRFTIPGTGASNKPLQATPRRADLHAGHWIAKNGHQDKNHAKVAEQSIRLEEYTHVKDASQHNPELPNKTAASLDHASSPSDTEDDETSSSAGSSSSDYNDTPSPAEESSSDPSESSSSENTSPEEHSSSTSEEVSSSETSLASRDGLDRSEPLHRAQSRGATSHQLTHSQPPYVTKRKPLLVPNAIPGQGLSRTRKRNARRKVSQKLARLKAAGALPRDASTADLISWTNGNQSGWAESIDLELEAGPSRRIPQINALEVRRQALLDGLEVVTLTEQDHATGTVNGSHTNGVIFNDSESPSTALGSRPSVPSEAQLDNTAPVAFGAATLDKAANEVASTALSVATPLKRKRGNEPSDYGGEANSYSKSLTINENLDGQLEAQLELQHEGVERSALSEENWRDNLSLTAVECCYEGVRLSTPPFPFVQRWDKEQNYWQTAGTINSHTKNKRQRRAQSITELDYDEPSGQDGFAEASHVESTAFENDCDSRVLEIDPNETARAQSAEHSKLPPEELRPEDLPDLPEDLATLPALTREDAERGAIITFKHIEMSSTTNWSPVVSGQKTAVIDSVEEGGDLVMTLAHRDRESQVQDTDLQTGERLYSKFDMPGYSSDDEGDNGYLEMGFAQLIEPKLVKAAPTS